MRLNISKIPFSFLQLAKLEGIVNFMQFHFNSMHKLSIKLKRWSADTLLRDGVKLWYILKALCILEVKDLFDFKKKNIYLIWKGDEKKKTVSFTYEEATHNKRSDLVTVKGQEGPNMMR